MDDKADPNADLVRTVREIADNTEKIMTALVGPDRGLNPERPGLIVQVANLDRAVRRYRDDIDKLNRRSNEATKALAELSIAKKATVANWQTVVSIVAAIGAAVAIIRGIII
tara:strand:- start:407 stop:742 length:336 start_codon:yes stop_codon:yes gene_type:complete